MTTDDEEAPPYAEVLADTVDRIRQLQYQHLGSDMVAGSPILAVLTDGMWWDNEGPSCSCTEAEAFAAAAVLLGADIHVMADLVVTGHGQPDRSEDGGDDHWHQGGPQP